MNIYTYSIHNFKCEAIHLCNKCNREFKSEKALIAHKVFHKPGYKEKHRQNVINASEKISKTKKKLSFVKKQKLISEYNKNPKICQECNNAIPFKGGEKFCSKSCAAKFNNAKRIHSEETKIKISNSIKNKIYSEETNNKRKVSSKVFFITCKYCENLFTSKTDKKLCSKQCQSNYNKINHNYPPQI